MYKESSLRVTVDLSSETMELRRQWNDISAANKNQKRIMNLAKVSLKNEGEINMFLEQQKRREFITTRNTKGSPSA